MRTLFLVLLPFSALADDEVVLVDAWLSPTALTAGSSCPSCWDMAGQIEVDNLAWDKVVQVVYRTGSGTWETLDAVYEGPSTGNREYWSFDAQLGYVYPRHVQVAVRYEVAGQQYWDNNGGIDHVVTPEGLLDDAPIELVDAELGVGLGCYGLCGDLEVWARIEDTGGPQEVWLGYRLDGGPWQRQQLSWSADANPGFEYWTLYIPYLPVRDPDLEFGLMRRTPAGRAFATDGGRPFVR